MNEGIEFREEDTPLVIDLTICPQEQFGFVCTSNKELNKKLCRDNYETCHCYASMEVEGLWHQ